MKVNILAFPFAGGSSFSYTSWIPHLDEDFKLYTFEPNGHGKRFNKSCYGRFSEQVEDGLGFVNEHSEDAAYVLFGHSMGAYVVYELLKEINKNGLKKPLGVIYSGNIPPHISEYESREDVDKMNNDEFIEYVKEDGGMPEEIFETKEIREMFLPIIKNDYRLVQSYDFKGEIEKFDDDIAVFYGKEDKISMEALKPWNLYSKKETHLCAFEGGHMFVSFEAENVAHSCMDYIQSLLGEK